LGGACAISGATGLAPGEALAARRAPVDAVDALDLDRALQKLQQIDPNQAQLVEMRSFGGLTVEETADYCFVISRASVWN
jgi:DNA-directed RNA polymerase specialized sigma24 family protein